MRSAFILSLICLLFSTNLFAQDKLFLVSGNEVEVQVIKVDQEHVLARSMNPADEHIYKYPKAEVVRIEYADGRVEHFDEKLPNDDLGEDEFVKEGTRISRDSIKRVKPARRKERLFYIGLGTGLNLPLGRYAGTDGYDNGYAKPGSFFNFESSILFSRSIGISLNLGYANNKMRPQAVEQKWELPTVTNYSSNVGAYNHVYFLLGPFMTIKTDQKLYVDLKVRWGISFMPEPSYSFSYTDASDTLITIDNINDTTNRRSTYISPYTIDLGFAIRYNFSKRFGMVFQYDWMIVPIFYDANQRINKYYNGNLVSTQSRTIPIGEIASFNTIGLGFYFMIVGPD